MYTADVNNFEDWRDAARSFLQQNTAPQMIDWQNQSIQTALFAENLDLKTNPNPTAAVPKEFLQLAERVSCHADP